MVDLRVRWMEGAFEQEVTRTTFAADPAVVAAAMAPIAAQAAEEEAAADEDADSDDAAAPSEPAADPTELPRNAPGAEGELED
jgi:hypothetical protein